MSRADLAPFAYDAEHLDRLLADTDLVARLRARDYTGPDWEFVATNAFAGYGYAVLGGWMRAGQIWDKVAERCRGLRLKRPPFSAPWDQEAWHTIATDALAEAIPSFATPSSGPVAGTLRRRRPCVPSSSGTASGACPTPTGAG